MRELIETTTPGAAEAVSKPAGLGWRVGVLCCLLLVGCGVPVPVQPLPNPKPPTAEQRRFTSAVFSIYHQARHAEASADSRRRPALREAASIVAEGAPQFGEIWRVLSIVQLAAAGISKPDYAAAIGTLAGTSRASGVLQRLLASHPRAERDERERIVYEFLLGPDTPLALSPSSQPDCQSTYPKVDAESEHGVAWATVSAFVQKPLADLAANMDPQNWDNPCGKLLFNATYLTDLKADGTFDVDPETYDAAPGNAETEGETWGPRYLFEWVMPGAGSNFFKTILSVTTERQADSYQVKFYDLEVSLRSRLSPDAAKDGGLLVDEGAASATPGTSPWTLIQGSKKLRIDDIWSHTPDELADDAATTLKMMGTGFAYWACCPR